MFILILIICTQPPNPRVRPHFSFSCHELQRKCCHFIFRPNIAPLLSFLLIGLIGFLAYGLWLVLTFLFPKLVAWDKIVSINPSYFRGISNFCMPFYSPHTSNLTAPREISFCYAFSECPSARWYWSNDVIHKR